MNVRELVTKFVFQGDTAKVKAFDQAVDRAKQAAQKADAAVVAMGKAVEKASRATNEGARAVVSGVEKMRRQVVGDTQAIAAGYENAAKAARDFEKATRGADGRMRGADGKFLPGGGKPGAGGHGSAGVGMAGLFGGLGHHMGQLAAGYIGLHAGVAGVEHYSEFEQNIQKAAAAMAAGSSDMGKLRQAIQEMRDKALEFSQQLGFNPRQVSETMMEIGSKGFEAKDVTAMTPTALKLARAGMADPKVATKLLVSAIEGFYGRDQGAKKHEEVGDLLVGAHDAGGLSLESLQEVVKYSASAAGGLKQDMKQIMTLAAVLGRYGIEGSMSGNGIKSMLLKLAAPAHMNAAKLSEMGLEGRFEPGKINKKGHQGKGHMKGQSVLDALGITTTDAKKNLLPMVDIMKQVVAKVANKGTKERAAIFRGLFGLEDVPQGMAIARAMAEDGGKAFLEVAARMDRSTGALNRMTKIMNEGLIPAWQRLKAKGEVLADLLIEKLAPSIVGLLDAASAGVDGAIALVKWLDDVTDHGRKVEPVLNVVKLAMAELLLYFTGAAILKAVEGIGKIVKALRVLTVAELEAAIVAAAVPLAVGAMAAIAVLAIQDMYTYLQGGDSIYGGAIDTINAAFQRLMAMFPNVSRVIAAFTNWFTSTILAWGNAMATFVGMAINLLVTMFTDPKNAWTAFKAFVVETFGAIKDFIVTAIQGAITFIASVLDVLPGQFDRSFEKAYQAIEKWVGQGIAKLKELASHIPGAGLFTGDGSPPPPKPTPGSTEKAMPLVPETLPTVWTEMGKGNSSPWSAPTLPAPRLAGGGDVNVTTTVHVSGGGDAHDTGRIIAGHVNRAAASAARQVPRQVR